jgi:hypothetical protein
MQKREFADRGGSGKAGRPVPNGFVFPVCSFVKIQAYVVETKEGGAGPANPKWVRFAIFVCRGRADELVKEFIYRRSLRWED